MQYKHVKVFPDVIWIDYDYLKSEWKDLII